LAEQGKSLPRITRPGLKKTVLGRAAAVITLRTYAHLWPGDEDRTRNVLDAALGPLGARADSLRTEAASKG